MYKIQKLINGLTLITIDVPQLESVTTMVAVGTGSRFENQKNSGISHFLEHMFFKGSKTYPSAEQIATLVDGIGAVNNAATSKEYTYYWIKSAAKHLELSTKLLASMIKEPLLQEEEIEKEKGVIIEEIRMIRDNPGHYVWDLYENLQYGDQPLGWDIIGTEKTIKSFTQSDFLNYIDSFYSPKNMALIYAGKIPDNIKQLAQKYFLDLPERGKSDFPLFNKSPQSKPKIHCLYKKTDQAHLVLGGLSYSRKDPKKYAARLLGLILGGGMSSRLFLEVREKRGLAYSVSAGSDLYSDTGSFITYAGLRLDKLEEGLKVIKEQLDKTKNEKVSDEELKKVKEMERGRMSLRSESTNFLAEYFGLKYVLDAEIETFEQYLDKIDAVTSEEIQSVAQEIFFSANYNLQLIAPLKDVAAFEKILQN